MSVGRGERGEAVAEVERPTQAWRRYIQQVVLDAITEVLQPEGIMLGRVGLVLARNVVDRIPFNLYKDFEERDP